MSVLLGSRRLNVKIPPFAWKITPNHSERRFSCPAASLKRASADLTNPWTIKVAHIPGSGENPLSAVDPTPNSTLTRVRRSRTRSITRTGVRAPTPRCEGTASSDGLQQQSVDADGGTDSPDRWVRICRFLLHLLLLLFFLYLRAHVFYSVIQLLKRVTSAFLFFKFSAAPACRCWRKWHMHAGFPLTEAV